MLRFSIALLPLLSLVAAKVDLPYTRYDGDDPYAIMTHGSGSHPWIMNHKADYLMEIASEALTAINHSYVTYTARGYARTSGWQDTAESDVEQFTWNRLADDMIDMADDQHIDRFVGVGHSMGSATALIAAIKHPERFLGLVLMLLPTAWEGRAGRRSDLMDIADEMLRKFHEKGMLTQFVLRGNALSDLPDKNDTALYARIKCPVLLLSMETNLAHPLITAQTVHRLIPQSRLVVTKYLEQVKRDWGGLIQEFIRSLKNE